jgi:hypothetical protein
MALAVCGASAGLLGCGGGGRLDLVLDLPEDPALRPEGMATVTVVAQPFEDDPVETTSVLDGTHFEAGDLPAGEAVAIAVELRDGTSRMVGYGRGDAPVELSADDAIQQRIFVRRPFLYAASATGLFTFDPTRNALDADYQGRLTTPAPIRAVALGGDELAVVSASAVDVVNTEDHLLGGATVPLAAAPADAAPVPGTRKVVLGVSTGFVIADLETGTATPVDGPPIARVTVGLMADGRAVAYGLVDRVAPPEIDEACSTTVSTIARFDVDNPVLEMYSAGAGLADIAAGIDAPALVGAAPCLDAVVSLDIETNTTLADLPRAAVVAIQGTRVWAAGTEAARIIYDGAIIDYCDDDAIQVLISVDIRGGGPQVVRLPRRRETMIDTDDPAREHAQVMKPLSALPLDLVVLAGGEFVALATRYRFHSSALVQTGPLGNVVVLPQMDATTSDIVLVDGASLTPAQRVRSACTLVAGTADIFPNWTCGDATESEQPKFAQYETIALGALFGAR